MDLLPEMTAEPREYGRSPDRTRMLAPPGRLRVVAFGPRSGETGGASVVIGVRAAVDEVSAHTWTEQVRVRTSISGRTTRASIPPSAQPWAARPGGNPRRRGVC